MKSVSLFSIFIAFLAAPVMGLAAKADMKQEDCAQVLSSPISDSAKVYIRLVQHYLKRHAQESVGFLARLIEAKKIVNPFAGKVDSLSGQLSEAMVLTISKLKPEDWAQIRQMLMAMRAQAQDESADKSEKKHQTETIFNPKEIARKDFSHISEGSPAYYAAAGRVFVTVVERTGVEKNNGYLHLFELKNDQLEELSKIQVSGTVNAKLSWFAHQGRTLFTYAAQGEPIYLYELIGGEPTLLSQVDLKFKLSADVSWRLSGDNVFISFGRANALYLYEFANNELNYLSMASGKFSYPSPKWHLIDGREYISFYSKHDGENAHAATFLYEVKNKTLKFLDEKIYNYRADIGHFRVSHLFGQRHILPGGFYYDGIHIFEIVDGRIKALSKGDHFRNIKPGQDPFTFENSDLFVIDDKMSHLTLVELRDDNLRPISEVFGSRVPSSPWLNMNSRMFVARSNNDGHLSIDELVGDKDIVEKWRASYNQWDNQSLLQVSDQIYLIVKVEKSIRVIKAFDSLGAQ